MTQDDEIQAIVEVGRRTRAPVPRGLWIAAAILGGLGAIGGAVALLGEPAHRRTSAPGSPPASIGPPSPSPPPSPSGADGGAGLAIGAAGGLIVGFALGRHRRDHSSRSRP